MLSPMTLLSRVVEVQVLPNSSTLMPPLPHDAQHADGADDDGVGGSPKGQVICSPCWDFRKFFGCLHGENSK